VALNYLDFTSGVEFVTYGQAIQLVATYMDPDGRKRQMTQMNSVRRAAPLRVSRTLDRSRPHLGYDLTAPWTYAPHLGRAQRDYRELLLVMCEAKDEAFNTALEDLNSELRVRGRQGP
jgi:hypothetical protein